MGAFNFKSAGKTKEQQLVEKIESTKTPIGIKTPLQIANDGKEILITYDNLADVVHDNLRNLLLTNWGERLGLYEFGANLKPLTTEYVSNEDFDSAAIERISNAVSKWMPYITLENYLSSIEQQKNLSKFNIRITYSVPSLNVSNKMLEINMFIL